MSRWPEHCEVAAGCVGGCRRLRQTACLPAAEHGGQCDPAIAHRADCGMAVGKDEYSCVTAGCCWDPTASLRPDPNSAVPWCYHKQPPPAGADPQRYWAQKKAMLLM